MTDENNLSQDYSAEGEYRKETKEEQASKTLVEQAREIKERYKNPAEVKKDVYLAAVVGATVMVPFPFLAGQTPPYP